MKSALVVATAALLLTLSPLAQANRPGVRSPEPEEITRRPAAASCTAFRETFIYRKGDQRLDEMAARLDVLRDPSRPGGSGLPGFEKVEPLNAAAIRLLRVTIDEGNCAPKRSEREEEASWGGALTPKYCEEVGCIDPNPPAEWEHYLPGSKVRVEACMETVSSPLLIIERWEKQPDGRWKLISRTVTIMTTSCELSP